MNISNTLWNDTKEAKIAYAEQLFDRVVNWQDYHYTGDNGQTIYPFADKTDLDKFQDKLNKIFLTHYTEYKTFLNTKGVDGVIDTWQDVEEFLRNITDDETMTLMKLFMDLEAAAGNLNIRMSTTHEGMLEAVTGSDQPLITKSNLDAETGAINIVYTYE